MELNQNFLRQLVETIPVPIFFKDRAGRYTGCNEAFETYLGMKREQFIGCTVYDIAPPDLADVYFEADEALFKTGGVQVYETWVKSGNGTRRNVVFHKAVFVLADGSAGGLVGVILDVTEHKQSQETLRIVRCALDSLQPLAICDQDNRIRFGNHGFFSKLGYKPDEVLDQEQVFGPSDLWETVAQEGRAQGVMLMRHKDDKSVEEPVAITEIREKGFSEPHYLVTLRESPTTGAMIPPAQQLARLPRAKTTLPGAPLVMPGCDLVGSSEAMKRLIQTIARAAAINAEVLITGESGTGKECVARAIHRHSSRANYAFIPVNCGSLPAALIQSELFGHERGSFTGAFQHKRGRIEAASGGTLFLDEIGDLPLELQATLLRFLQEKTIDRVGGESGIPVDVRVVAATNVDLKQAVRQGRFREDLFYRLNLINIHVPPLRERSSDIRELVDFFWTRYGGERNSRVEGFSQDALAALERHHWPGNVRELINCVRRAMIMSEGPQIAAGELCLTETTTTFPLTLVSTDILTLQDARESGEETAIRLALNATNGNVTSASRRLGVSRISLYRLMKKHDL